MRFSDNLRNFRLQHHLTQMELAKGIGTSQSAVAAWENETREPDFKTIQKIANYFNVPMSALLPSNDLLDASYVNAVAESLHQNPKLKLLFDRTKNFSERDLDAILAICESIDRSRD